MFMSAIFVSCVMSLKYFLTSQLTQPGNFLGFYDPGHHAHHPVDYKHQQNKLKEGKVQNGMT